jgi:hypothetical protein
MASEKSPLTVIRSPTAIDELDDVWRWNAVGIPAPNAGRRKGAIQVLFVYRRAKSIRFPKR